VETSPWVTLCLISNCVNPAVPEIPHFAEDQWVWRKKIEIIVTCQKPKFDIILQKLEMLRFGLQTYYLLHSCVGCTADVTGYHHQAAGVEACHHRRQVDLEPLLKFFRFKFFEFRSKGCQGQVQDGFSYTWISDEGDVSLEIKGFTLQFRRSFCISEIIVVKASLVTHLCTLVHQGHQLSIPWWPFIQEAWHECILLSAILATSKIPPKCIHPRATSNRTVYQPALC